MEWHIITVSTAHPEYDRGWENAFKYMKRELNAINWEHWLVGFILGSLIQYSIQVIFEALK